MYLIPRPGEIMIMREREREAWRPWPWTGVKEKPLPGEEEEEENEEILTHKQQVNEWAKRREKTIPSYPYFIWVFFCWLVVVSPHTYSHSLPSAYSSCSYARKKTKKTTTLARHDALWLPACYFSFLSLVFYLLFYFLHPSVCPFYTRLCVCVCSGTARTQGTGAVA